jgi:hypothetical protein
MQLVAYGAQDVYLTGNPQITFFKAIYRRHTNFSLESIEQTFSGTVGFGKKVTCTVSRNGDLINRMYLRVQMPAIKEMGTTASMARWIDSVGHALINTVEIEIGGQKIDKHYGEWLHIWNELTQTPGHAVGYNNLIGNHPAFTVPRKADSAQVTAVGDISVDEGTLYIPLQFWFCRNPGLALPLIALQYHEVKINFEFRALDDLVVYEADTYSVDGGLGATLFVDYVYLDTDERRRFAQVTHEYLIEQLQFTGSESIPSNQKNVKLKLNFNHPCKELIWTVRDNKNVSNKVLAAAGAPVDWDFFNYAVNDANTPTGMMTGSIATGGAGGNDLVSVSALYGGINPVTTAKLQLNAHDRFSQRDGKYFNQVQPLQHHTASPPVGINLYSFALKPEEHQPSGSCNMSRIDNATLQLELAEMPDGAQVSVYATNYNVLRIMSGMGGLAYASIVSSMGVSSVSVSLGAKMVNMIFTGFTHAFGR